MLKNASFCKFNNSQLNTRLNNFFRMLRVNEKLVQVSSRTGMRGKRIPTRPGKSWVKTRPERLADSKLPLALAKGNKTVFRKYSPL